MSIDENLFASKVVSEVSGASDKVAEARKVLWSFRPGMRVLPGAGSWASK
jgi:hypothetical protein